MTRIPSHALTAIAALILVGLGGPAGAQTKDLPAEPADGDYMDDWDERAEAPAIRAWRRLVAATDNFEDGYWPGVYAGTDVAARTLREATGDGVSDGGGDTDAGKTPLRRAASAVAELDAAAEARDGETFMALLPGVERIFTQELGIGEAGTLHVETPPGRESDQSQAFWDVRGGDALEPGFEEERQSLVVAAIDRAQARLSDLSGISDAEAASRWSASRPVIGNDINEPRNETAERIAMLLSVAEESVEAERLELAGRHLDAAINRVQAAIKTSDGKDLSELYDLRDALTQARRTLGEAARAAL
jgi:predicted DNA-binding protein (UPF0251 family)